MTKNLTQIKTENNEYMKLNTILNKQSYLKHKN